jgi:hypothetical protein
MQLRQRADASPSATSAPDRTIDSDNQFSDSNTDFNGALSSRIYLADKRGCNRPPIHGALNLKGSVMARAAALPILTARSRLQPVSGGNSAVSDPGTAARVHAGQVLLHNVVS